MEGFNKQQSRAAEGVGGVELVIAGAGSGKTRTLIGKIISIVRTPGFDPGNLLLLTFSRKAAEEIRERAEKEAGFSGSEMFAGTFHSFAYKIIRDYSSELVSLSDFTGKPSIIEQKERENFIFSEIKRDLHRFKGLPGQAVYDIINKKEGINGRLLTRLNSFDLHEEIEKIRQSFKKYKADNNLIEFDDMMHYAALIIRSNSHIRSELQNRFRYILVDEFQDTSDDNFELISLLLSENKPNFFAVGDDWQSIYGFRNSNINYILNFRKYFPSAVVHRLTVNYRSRKEIVNVANRFILKNKNRTRKKLVSFTGAGGAVNNRFCSNAFDEISEITRIAMSENSEMIAVLYRNNSQGRFIKKHMKESVLEKLELMTIHASKGLEFDVVILAGISDYVIPDKMSDIEEERRLMYVALTRARERLYILSHSDERDNPPRFFKELSF